MALIVAKQIIVRNGDGLCLQRVDSAFASIGAMGPTETRGEFATTSIALPSIVTVSVYVESFIIRGTENDWADAVSVPTRTTSTANKNETDVRNMGWLLFSLLWMPGV